MHHFATLIATDSWFLVVRVEVLGVVWTFGEPSARIISVTTAIVTSSWRVGSIIAVIFGGVPTSVFRMRLVLLVKIFLLRFSVSLAVVVLLVFLTKIIRMIRKNESRDKKMYLHLWAFGNFLSAPWSIPATSFSFWKFLLIRLISLDWLGFRSWKRLQELTWFRFLVTSWILDLELDP